MVAILSKYEMTMRAWRVFRLLLKEGRGDWFWNNC